MGFIKTPEILLPKDYLDYNKWAVIACDQFTSEKDYWYTLKKKVDNVPSTYHMILPEAFLDEDTDHKIAEVNDNMELYLRSNIFDRYEGFILVNRKTPHVEKRLGLVLAVDLEAYEHEEGKEGLIRSTEATVKERIPPRMHIREHASLELPHVQLLVDDKEGIIDDLYKQKDNYKKLYDFDLNMDGGHLEGYLIEETRDVIRAFETIESPVKMIVGDGNHSLAAAKAHWENVKEETQEMNHPARYALVEVISLYDEGLTVEPIHRIIYDADENLLQSLQKLEGKNTLSVFHEGKTNTIQISDNPFEAVRQIQDTLDEYLMTHIEASIDFVHGLSSLKRLTGEHKHAFGIVMPKVEREALFPYIKANGPLPRKSFSLGEAKEKRYYMEARIIKEGKEIT